MENNTIEKAIEAIAELRGNYRIHKRGPEFRYSKSGMGCTLYEWGRNRVARANGCGYDRAGTCFAAWMKKNFPLSLRVLAERRAHQVWTKGVPGIREAGNSAPLYGLRLVVDDDGKAVGVEVDGACGMESMQSIFTAMGGVLLHVSDNKSSTHMLALWPEIMED